MAGHGQLPAVLLVAETGLEVERKLEGFGHGGQPELLWNEGPKEVFVVEDMFLGVEAGYLVGIFQTGITEDRHTAQGETAVADASEHLAMEYLMGRLEAEFEPKVLLEWEAGIAFAGGPRGRHVIVAAPAPVVQFVAEHPGIDMADEYVLVVVKETVEVGRHHHLVVAGYAAGRTEPLG